MDLKFFEKNEDDEKKLMKQSWICFISWFITYINFGDFWKKFNPEKFFILHVNMCVLLLPTLLKYHHSLIMISSLLVVDLKVLFCILMCVVVAFGIPYQHLTVLFHSKHPIVSSQKRNRYPHSLKDTCRDWLTDDL